LLGEAIFCHRAARFQFEQGLEEDTGDESGTPARGWFRRPYTLNDARRLVRTAAIRLVAWALVAGALFFGSGFTTTPWRIGLAVFSALATLGALVAAFRLAVAAYYLVRAGFGREVDVPEDHSEPIEIGWWSLLQSGFQRTFLDAPLSDSELKLSGKPWCILRKGDLRIPVFRKKGTDAKVRAQHYSRMAAYGRLIETRLGGKAPYGVMLRGYTYQAVTVPLSARSHAGFQRALRETRQIVARTDHPPPGNVGRCRGCPWGRPMVTEYTRSTGAKYESPCGARYAWVPPHDKARHKGLV
jgi:hypothetical protein